MKIVALIFLLIAYTTTASMILNAATPGSEFDFPTLDVPDLDADFPSSCSGFFDCTEYLADVIKAIGKSILFLALLSFNLVVYIFDIFLLIVTLAATGIDGAPPLVNTLFFTVPMTAIGGIILFKMITRGNDEA